MHKIAEELFYRLERYYSMLKPELTVIAESILRENYEFDEPVRTLIPLKGGEWSAAYKYTMDSQDFVIRLSHTPDNFFRDRIASKWSSSALPVPQIIKIDRYGDQYYAISQFFPGEAFEKLSPPELEKTIPSFLSMMTAIHSINLDTMAGFGCITSEGRGAYNSWSKALLDVNNDRPDSLTHGWKKILERSPEVLRKYNHFYDQLAKLVQYCPEQKNLIHSDLLYQNLLVHNNQVSAVLDWGCAMIGDPLYDIAIFNFFEPWFPAFSEVDLIKKMRQSYLDLAPGNSQNYNERILACQIHLTLGNIAYCALSEGKHDYLEHINRLDEVLRTSGEVY